MGVSTMQVVTGTIGVVLLTQGMSTMGTTLTSTLETLIGRTTTIATTGSLFGASLLA